MSINRRLYVKQLGFFLLIAVAIIIMGNKLVPGSDEGTIIREYSSYLKVSTEYNPDTKNRLFEFANISGETLMVKLIPYKYRPYLNEFDALPDGMFTTEGYDNYVEFELKPGDIQWREFTISQVSVWKMNVEVRIKKS
jgi:hypothetical protein